MLSLQFLYALLSLCHSFHHLTKLEHVVVMEAISFVSMYKLLLRNVQLHWSCVANRSDPVSAQQFFLLPSDSWRHADGGVRVDAISLAKLTITYLFSSCTVLHHSLIINLSIHEKELLYQQVHHSDLGL